VQTLSTKDPVLIPASVSDIIALPGAQRLNVYFYIDYSLPLPPMSSMKVPLHRSARISEALCPPPLEVRTKPSLPRVSSETQSVAFHSLTDPWPATLKAPSNLGAQCASPFFSNLLSLLSHVQKPPVCAGQ
jgi:hypothetical protein